MTHTDTPRSIRYSWASGSHISRLDAQMDSDGFYVISLFPGKEEKEGTLAAVPALLHRYGFPDAYADAKDGQSVLTLANVKAKSLDKLVHVLGGAEFTAGAPVIEAINGHTETISAEERRKQEKIDTVKWHGRVGLVGHASIFIAGLLQKPFDFGRIINAPLGAVNPFLMSWLGSGKDHVDVPGLMRDMRSFFAQEGINLPYMSGEDQHMGFYETAKHFLAAHPIEVGSTLGVMGSAAMITSGIKGMRAGGAGAARLALGLVNITRDGIAILVPEKKSKQPEELQGSWVDSIVSFPGKAARLASHPGEIPAAAWGFVKEAPLRMVGALSLVSDVLFFKDAADAWKKNEQFRSDQYISGGVFKQKKWFGGERKIQLEGLQNVLLQSDAQAKNAQALFYDFHGIKADQNGKLSFIKGHKKDLSKLKELEKAMETSADLFKKARGMEINREMANSWQGKVTPLLGITTALAFLGAGVLMTISSKHHKGNNLGAEALFSRLCSINAKVLAAFPEEKREPMLHRLTDYMRLRKDITGEEFNADRFEQEVRSRIDQMQHSPWTERVKTPPAGLSVPAMGAAVA